MGGIKSLQKGKPTHGALEIVHTGHDPSENLLCYSSSSDANVDVTSLVWIINYVIYKPIKILSTVELNKRIFVYSPVMVKDL